MAELQTELFSNESEMISWSFLKIRFEPEIKVFHKIQFRKNSAGLYLSTTSPDMFMPQ